MVSIESEPLVLAQFLTYMSCNDLFKFVPTRARFEAEIAQLPTDWTVRICGFLEYVRDYSGALGEELQRHALDAFALEPLRKDLIRHYNTTGRFFLFEEQLLGMMKFAILGGAIEIPELITVEQRKAFFWALMLYSDLHSAENPVENIDDAARLELRQLAFVTQEVPGNVMARAYALWVDLPSRPELVASPYFVNMPAEFAHAANGHPVTDYITVVSVLLAHGSDAVRDTIAASYPRWPFDAPARFGASTRAAELTATLRSFAGNRSDMTALFATMPPAPAFLGLAMLPFMHRPVYVAADGKFLVVSMRLLVDGLYSHAYWRVWEHLKTQHGAEGNALSATYTQFYGQVLERYVVELMRSVYDTGGKRVFAEEEAQPAQGAADAAVFLDDRVILVEVTRTELRYFPTLLAGDLDNFKNDLARTAAKAKQVATAAKAVHEGKVIYAGHENAVTLPIERIVVLPEPLPRFPIVASFLRKALEKAGVTPDATIISVSELEDALRAGDLMHLSTLIADWKADPDFFDVSLHDFIRRRGRLVPSGERAPFIAASFEAFRKKAIEQMAFDPATAAGVPGGEPPAGTDGEAEGTGQAISPPSHGSPEAEGS